jgi:hypothetical protein
MEKSPNWTSWFLEVQIGGCDGIEGSSCSQLGRDTNLGLKAVHDGSYEYQFGKETNQ